MPSCAHPVPGPLRPYVRSCVGYDYRLDPEAVHHGLPSPGLTVIIAFDEPLDCGWVGDSGRGRFTALLAGLHTTPTLIRTHGRQAGIQLSVTPAGARALFDLPAAAVAGEVVGEIPGLPGDLQRRLQGVPWPERFRLLEGALLARLDPAPLRPEIMRAWDRVCDSNGSLRVEELAAEVGLSRRGLLSGFRRELGITPSEARRIARFAYARHLLLAGRRPAEVAALAGYADQPHLNREFRSLAAMTPLETLDDFPFVQDDPG